MTFEQLIVKYLYQHKQISLQGFGTITLMSNVPDSEMIHKNRQILIEGITFDYNMKAQTDEAFVLFYSQQLGKIKPLAISDIESHLQLAKQLMNIGKPYEVDGLGIFAMQKDGNVVLHPGNYAITVADNNSPHNRLRERTEQQEKTEAETSGGIGGGLRKGLLVVGILLALGVAGWFIWTKFINVTPENGSAVSTTATDSLQQLTDSLVPATDSLTLQDTAAASRDSLSKVVALPAADTIKWRAYFRTFQGKERVNTMQQLYKKYNPVIETTDSVVFRVYVMLSSPLADTAAKTDSLRKVFFRPVTLEKVNP